MLTTPETYKNQSVAVIEEMRSIAEAVLERNKVLKDRLEYESYALTEEGEELLEQLKFPGYTN